MRKTILLIVVLLLLSGCNVADKAYIEANHKFVQQYKYNIFDKYLLENKPIPEELKEAHMAELSEIVALNSERMKRLEE